MKTYRNKVSTIIRDEINVHSFYVMVCILVGSLTFSTGMIFGYKAGRDHPTKPQFVTVDRYNQLFVDRTKKGDRLDLPQQSTN